jgi:hypothetical protein
VSPGEVGGVGKLDSASMKGGILPSSGPVLAPGLMDLMPTMMMGTMRPSPSTSPSWPPEPDALPRLSCVLLLPSSLLVPNLNILKKLSGC